MSAIVRIRNRIYQIHQLVIRREPEPAVFDTRVKRWRDPRTGRFISSETARRMNIRVGVIRYWNRIRTIVAEHENWTFADARRYWREFSESYDRLSDEERREWRRLLFPDTP